MKREAAARIYALMRGDTQIGVLTEYEIDQPWFLCHFVAALPFAEICPLFDAELEAIRVDTDAWEKAYEAIDVLNLYLISHDGKVIESMLLHIQDDKAWFRY